MTDTPSHRARRRRSHDGAGDKLANVLEYLSDIEEVLGTRDWMGLAALLRKRVGSNLPREVREELLMLSRAPRTSLRAPVQFLRFQHRMTQLAKAGEPMPTAQTEMRLEPEAEVGMVRRPNGERRAAADPLSSPRDEDASGRAP